MPVPEFNDIKSPALAYFADGQPHKVSDVFRDLADHFHLTEEDRNELLPSGTQRRWHNRANWACYDLYRAGLIERLKRGQYVITDMGRTVAAEKPAVIDREYLMRFPKFADFLKVTEEGDETGLVKSSGTSPSPVQDNGATPLEQLEKAHETLSKILKQEVLEKVRAMDPIKFEKLVLDLLVAMGYGGSRKEARMTKASHDEGIDGIINLDPLGLELIHIQAKRQQDNVGRKEIQSFVGALAGKQAKKGVFITTGGFAETANAYARNLDPKVIMIDGDKLADLMVRYNIGVTPEPERTYVVKRIDSDYFEEE